MEEAEPEAVPDEPVPEWVAYGGTTDVSPAPIEFLGQQLVFARGIGDSHIYVSKGSGWTAIPGSTNVGVTPVVFGETLFVFAIGLDNRIYYASTTNGTSWSGWSVISGSTNVSVAATVFNGRLYVFAKGVADNTVYATSSASANAGSWTSWAAIAGTTDVAPAATVLGNKMLLFSKGIVDKNIYFTTTTNGTSWGSWTALGGTTATGVRASVFNGDLYVVSPGVGDKRVYVTVTRDLVKWSGWFELPSRDLTSATAVGVNPYESSMLFYAADAAHNIYSEATALYRLPFTGNMPGWQLWNGNWDDPSGHGHPFGQAYAFDFVRDSNNDGIGEGGQAVRAMRPGTVIARASDRTCNTWNLQPGDPCYGAPGEGNYVLIRHSDNTVAAYDHMQYNQVVVAVGDEVPLGAFLGLSGNTGNSSTAHIHVDVRQYWNSAVDLGPTIPIYFTDVAHQCWRPHVGDALLSNQP